VWTPSSNPPGAGDLIIASKATKSVGRRKELSDVVAGKQGRTSDTEVTLFKSNGIAALGLAVAMESIARPAKRLRRSLPFWAESAVKLGVWNCLVGVEHCCTLFGTVLTFLRSSLLSPDFSPYGSCNAVVLPSGSPLKSEIPVQSYGELVCCPKLVHSRQVFRCSSISSTTDTSRSPSL